LTSATIAVGGILLWLLKQVLGPLIGQQAKGSIPGYTADKARKAARLLPSYLAEEYEQTWLAELKGPSLNDKPLSALKFALGLRHAARGIRIKSGLSRFRLVEFAHSVVGRRLSARPSTVKNRIETLAWAIAVIVLVQAVAATVTLAFALGRTSLLLILPSLLVTVLTLWIVGKPRYVSSDARTRRTDRAPRA
jgi:ABC-type multidrug transport system fused ATPase/permease subunit